MPRPYGGLSLTHIFLRGASCRSYVGDTLELPKLGPGKPTRHTAHNSAEVGPVLPGPRSPQSVADSALVISRLAWGQGALGLTACGSEWGLVSQGAPVWCQQKKPQVRVGQRQRRSGVTSPSTRGLETAGFFLLLVA